MKIGVIGAGYVGLSNALVLSVNNDVTIFDINSEKITKLQAKESPIHEAAIDKFLKKSDLNFHPTHYEKSAYELKDFIIIAVPTNFDEETNNFNTSILEDTISKALALNSNALIVIKSTIPIGYTNYISKKYKTKRVIYSPEFLREGQSLEDNLAPSRIIIGGNTEQCRLFGKTLIDATLDKDTPLLFMDSEDAESVKLFSNSYLAMRVAFFNEVDNFAIAKNLSADSIIQGMSYDFRIGRHYNNPSFGYGGYCLPKDTRQLLSDFKDIRQSLISAIVSSNKARKHFIADQIASKKPQIVGIYRLAMKSNSDNFRDSAIIDIIQYLKLQNIKIQIFEPMVADVRIFDSSVITDLNEFCNTSDIILANRIDEEIMPFREKIFSRDIFHEN